ncbi:MAG TPA: hypothetical protein VLB83_01745 [Candidatus Paceibacterota bacterium]|nr:hypothetical protein [Candidatus Paceibacterota bacterium]
MKYPRNIAALLVAFAIATIGIHASAQSATTTGDGTASTTPPVATTTPPVQVIDAAGEWKLEVGPKGQALLRGHIVSVSGSTVIVKTWGGQWTVLVGSGTEVLPRRGQAANLSDFLPGDYVGVSGTISAATPNTVNAKVFRNRTEVRRESEERKENKQALEQRLKEEKEKRENLLASVGKIVEGKVAAIATTTQAFTLTVKDKTYDVTTSSSTKFVDERWRTISFAAIAEGHKVRVFGVVTGSTISAEVVRDTSVK